MDQTETYNRTETEAVAVFHDVAKLQDAIDDLLVQNFDHAELSILAAEKTIRAKLGHGYGQTSEMEDDPDAPRISYVPNESLGNAQGGLVAVASYFPAVIGGLAVVGSGGTVLAAAAAAAAAGGAGAVIGAYFARMIGTRYSRLLQEQIDHGGIVLWVRTHDADHEQRALETLRRHAGDDVHLHVPQEPRIKSTVIPTRQPLLSFGRPH